MLYQNNEQFYLNNINNRPIKSSPQTSRAKTKHPHRYKWILLWKAKTRKNIRNKCRNPNRNSQICSHQIKRLGMLNISTALLPIIHVWRRINGISIWRIELRVYPTQNWIRDLWTLMNTLETLFKLLFLFYFYLPHQLSSKL